MREVANILDECIERLAVVNIALNDADLPMLACRAEAIRQITEWLRISLDEWFVTSTE